jgi:hypothetical protein
MAAEVKKEIQLEIAHVLFIDIVGYSKLLINEQRALLDTLNQIVRGTEEFRSAEAADRLIKIPTGDGMALVFYNSPEAPARRHHAAGRARRADLLSVEGFMVVERFAAVANVRGSGETWRRSRKPPCRTNADGRLSSCQ